MSTQPPPSMAITQILSHTPHWVWAILAAITALGFMQWREHRVSRGRLLVAPIGLGVFSLWGAASAFGAAAVPAWLSGMALAMLANRALRWPRQIDVGADGRFVLAGSPWPLLLMWALFALRYAAAVTMALQPGLAHSGWMMASLTTLYGALSGLFAARAWRVLQSARCPVAVQAA
jgi:hypothetical protein